LLLEEQYEQGTAQQGNKEWAGQRHSTNKNRVGERRSKDFGVEKRQANLTSRCESNILPSPDNEGWDLEADITSLHRNMWSEHYSCATNSVLQKIMYARDSHEKYGMLLDVLLS